MRPPGLLLSFVTLLGILFTEGSSGQVLGAWSQTNKEFAEQLYKDERYSELKLLAHSEFSNIGDENIRDTVNFLLGASHYHMEQMDSAAYYLGSLPRTKEKSSIQFKGAVLGATAYGHIGSPVHGIELLERAHPADPFQRALLRHHNLALTVLGRPAKFDSVHDPVDPTLHPRLSHSIDELEELSEESLGIQRKAGWKAGVLSGLVPGSGKVYAGAPWEGLSNFLQLGLLGAQTYEGYAAGGFRNPHFIVFGSIFSIFYIGNIWGSVLSVPVNKREHERHIRDRVLDYMHRFDRSAFDRSTVYN